MKKDFNIFDLSFEELLEIVKDLGEPRYRSSQVWHWLYQEHQTDPKKMTNLPKEFREKLAEVIPEPKLKPVFTQSSKDRYTRKILFQLADGKLIETVKMDYDRRVTLCVSTQAGCGMGCVFCATGQMGFLRNLSIGEIVAQVSFFAHEQAQKGERVTNIVMMGMGEPFHNYKNTIAAIDRFCDADAFNFGARKVTVSTVGLVPAIKRFADEKRQTSLAISLHAATDTERNELIKINKKWPIPMLMEACRYYTTKTGRRITFEWALIEGKNDTLEQGRALGKLIKGMNCYVNLIPLNPTNSYAGTPSSSGRVNQFQAELLKFGVQSTVRVRRGIDIQAGCGQLRDRIYSDSPSVEPLQDTKRVEA